MNLFDYIKFQSIDISNYDELITLPEDFIKMYWKAAANDNNYFNIPHKSYCTLLSQIYNDIEYKKVFLDTLKEYYKKHHEPV